MIDDFLSGRGDVKSQVASLFAHDLPGFLASLMDEGGFDNLWKALLLLWAAESEVTVRFSCGTRNDRTDDPPSLNFAVDLI